MKKGIIDIRWVPTPTRQRLVTSRKRTLRRRSVRAARSVWSGHRSCVIESRNFQYCPGLPDRCRGDRTVRHATTMSRGAGPGSESGAEVRVDIPGTCEGLPLPELNSRNGMKPVEQRPGLRNASAVGATAKQAEDSGYCHPSSRQGWRDGCAGRLSRLIVAFESWETPTGRSQ